MKIDRSARAWEARALLLAAFGCAATCGVVALGQAPPESRTPPARDESPARDHVPPRDQTPARGLAVRATGWVDGDGKIQTGALLVISDGKIVQVGGDAPAGAEIADYGTAVVSPGLIDVWSSLAAAGQLTETARAVTPELLARDAFNAHSRQFAAALQAGVTCFALLPDDQNLIGGRAAICLTAGADGRPALLDEHGPLKLSLSPLVFQPDREPSSRAGALGMLRDLLAEAHAGAADDGDALAAFAQGRSRGLMTAPAGADVLAALGLAQEYKLKLALRHDKESRAVAAEMARVGVGCIVGPYDLATSPRNTTAAGILERAGVRVAVSGGLPEQPADSLRVGAAVAARGGMSPEAARLAISKVPAEFLGISDRVGSIANGLRADLVVFSGDPLDLRSRVLAVYAGGTRVYAALAE